MVEYLRIKGGYYQRKALPDIFSSIVHPSLQAYARHVSYKEYLTAKLREIQGKEAETVQMQPEIEGRFSVLQWATIFYYANEKNLLPANETIKARILQFMRDHKTGSTFENFKTSYYEAKSRINKKNNYPIGKLESIIPFLKKNYNKTVATAESDVTILKEHLPDY
jgi:hypothetical protein